MENPIAHFNSQLKTATEKFPGLQIIEKNGTRILSGNFDIVIENNEIIESYKIEIHPTTGFPHQFPRLFEVGEKIPRVSDWHIYEDIGHCCITVPLQEAIWCKKGITVSNFIEQHVRPYLYNQTYRKKHGVYANGEFSHGFKGKWEYLYEIFQIQNEKKIIAYIESHLRNSRLPHKKSKCFCGSNSKMRKCHPQVYALFVSINKELLRMEIGQLKAIKQLTDNNKQTYEILTTALDLLSLYLIDYLKKLLQSPALLNKKGLS